MRYGKVIDGVTCVGLTLNGKVVWFELTWIAGVWDHGSKSRIA
jgi:hypothetical protein